MHMGSMRGQKGKIQDSILYDALRSLGTQKVISKNHMPTRLFSCWIEHMRLWTVVLDYVIKEFSFNFRLICK